MNIIVGDTVRVMIGKKLHTFIASDERRGSIIILRNVYHGKKPEYITLDAIAIGSILIEKEENKESIK